MDRGFHATHKGLEVPLNLTLGKSLSINYPYHCLNKGQDLNKVLALIQ